MCPVYVVQQSIRLIAHTLSPSTSSQLSGWIACRPAANDAARVPSGSAGDTDTGWQHHQPATGSRACPHRGHEAPMSKWCRRSRLLNHVASTVLLRGGKPESRLQHLAQFQGQSQPHAGQ
eukprot:1377767-Amphidinium_carterae.1